MLAATLVAAALALPALTSALPINAGAVIGVLTAPWCESDQPGKSGFLEGCENSRVSGFSVLEVKWLEQAGAKVVPIRYDAPPEELDTLFDSLNGVLYTGGSLSLLPNTTYYRTAKYLYDKSLKAYDAGDYFPLIGICMGFQLLNIMTAEDYSVLDHNAFDSESLVWPLELTRDGYGSRMLKHASEEVVQAFATENITINWHHDGVVPEKFYARPRLSEFYRVISYNHDLKGTRFISTIEGWERPVYGVQWHPEAVQFDWTRSATFINRSPHAIKAMQHLANFFVEEARLNNHRFPSVEAEEKALIYNYDVVRKHTSYEVYLFRH